MIRINLLPVRQAKKRAYGKQQLVFGLLLLIVECVVLFYVYTDRKSELNEIEGRVQQVQGVVSELEQENERVTALDRQIQQLQNMARVLDELEASRSGPVYVLDELKVILNRPATPAEGEVQAQLRGWNVNWDPTYTWVDTFVEEGGAVTITGRARSNEDIAQFSSRLASSPFFSNVRLAYTAAQAGTWMGRVYEFRITATVTYAVAVGEQG